MTRNCRTGAGTNAPTGATPAAAPTTTTARAGAFLVGPSFHALRVCSVLSLVLVRVCPILGYVASGKAKCRFRFGQVGLRVKLRGRKRWVGRERTRTTSMSASAGCARGCALDLLVEDAMRTRTCDVSASSASASS